MRPLSGGEPLREQLGDGADLCGRERPGRVEALREPALVESQKAVDAQGAEKRQVGIHEAERALYGRRHPLRRQRFADGRDLLRQRLDERRLVAASDLKTRLAEERLPDADLAPVALRVDDPHARRGDRDVIDVRAPTWKAPIVQQHDVLPATASEAPRHFLLPLGAALPIALMLRSLAQREQETAEARVTSAGVGHTIAPTAFVLGAGACAGGTGGLGGVSGRHRGGGAVGAIGNWSALSATEW